MKKILYAFILLLPSILFAQINGAERLQLPKNVRRYYTQKNYQRLMTLDKDMARRRAFLEYSVRDLSMKELPHAVTIPVVVHILYPTGTNTATLPTQTDVRQQLDIVTKDFRQTTKIMKHKADSLEHFSDMNAMDTKISFCLASQTATGSVTTGIFYIPTSVSTWSADDKMKSAATNGSSPFPSDKYLNIWVVNFPDTITGYAQMPFGPVTTDGIVIDARYFGKKPATDKTFPYTEGKTLTHLIGNYLNLYDLWSETKLHGDDGVDDTPIHNAPTNGCVEYRYFSTYGENTVAMTMNFMDNTNDACQYMFTAGQKKRMQASLVKGGARYNLAVWGDSICGKNNLQQSVQALQSDNNALKPATPTAQVFNYRIYPNPAQNNINLDIETDKAGDAEFTIFNAQGGVQKQMTYNIGEGNQSFNMSVSDWSAGIYLVRVKMNDTIKTEKLILSK